VPPTVPAPAALAAQGLTLATNSIPMGPLSIGGTPDQRWVQGPGPLAVEGSALQAFIAGVRSAEQNRSDWWGAIAPGVPFPAAMAGAQVGYTTHLSVTITTNHSTAQTVVLSTTVTLAGGSAPGNYALSATATIQGSQMVLTGWSLTKS